MKMFKSKKVNYSDLIAITSLFLDEEVKIFVFDPLGKVNWDISERKENEHFEKRVLFNFGEDLLQYKQYQLNEFDQIIDFGLKMTPSDFKTEQFRLIQAPSGTARYIFKKRDRQYSFLNFMQTATLRAKLIKFGVKCLTKINQTGLISQQFNIHYLNDFKFQQTINKVPHNNYSIFLGTPGKWRKPVIQLNENSEIVSYVKFPTSAQSHFLVQREKSNLRRIQPQEFTTLKTPEILHDTEDAALIQKPAESSKSNRQNKMNNVLFNSIKELMTGSIKHEKIEETDFFLEILDQLNFIRNNTNNQHDKIYSYLTAVKDNLKKNQYTTTAIAHGDFTPWNIIQNDESVYVYDWEMAIFGAPIFYDIFHFIYQSEILVNRKGISGVESELIQFFKQPAIEKFVRQYKIDVDFHHELYLLHVVSKNLALINQQHTISSDQLLLLKNWEQALSELPIKPSTTDARETFLAQFQDYLLDKKYAALKFFLSDFQALPIESDLDLAFDKSELAATEKFISNHPFVKKHILIKKSFMHTSQLHFIDGSYLSIDFIFDFIRKGKRYLSAENVISSVKWENNVARPLLTNDITYAQHFYSLNNSSIPLKYQQIFTQLLEKEGMLNDYLENTSKTYKLDFKTPIDSFNFSKEKKNAIKKHINTVYNLGALNALQKKASYLFDFLVDIKQNKGFIVTFSGVDGAGKTTIINAVKGEFEQKYRKQIVLLRHRPGILPILSAIKYGGVSKAEEKASQTLPRQGGNKNKLTSLIRFSYYLTDYLLGQIYVYFKYVLRGKVVIYDRYYFDFINDPKRSNIQLKPTFIKRFFKLIYKPAFNFYLYNDPEVILKRKQELNEKDIIELNEKYSSLFSEFTMMEKGVYHQIKNDIKSDTINEIFNTINKVA